MFSARLHWDLRPNPLSELLTKKRVEGADILDLTESNPTAAKLPIPKEAIVDAFADPRILRYDPNPAGILAAREAVSEYCGGEAGPERILLTASTSEAYAYLFKLLTDPGDEVLVPRPSYPLFEFLAGMEFVKVVQYPLLYRGGVNPRWQIDFEVLRHLATSRTKAIVVVNPNNPTGSFLDRTELVELVEFCAQRDLALLSDEVFADYGFGTDPDRVQSLRQVDSVLTFCLSGLSKVVGLPQVKLGWIAINGPATLRQDAMNRLELIADTYLSVGTPVQIAVPKLLEVGGGVRNAIRLRTAHNLDHLQTRIGPESPFRLLRTEGGWYSVLQVPRVQTEEEWILDLLEHCNVLVQPGFFYDFESEAYLVLSLLTEEVRFADGLARLIDRVPLIAG